MLVQEARLQRGLQKVKREKIKKPKKIRNQDDLVIKVENEITLISIIKYI
jgi:hypothetical protein